MSKSSQSTRRQILKGGAVSILGLPAAQSVSAAYVSSEDGFPYEIQRTDAEWHEMLTELEFDVMRLGATEKQRTSPLWNETAQGAYHCKGCDLKIYDSRWKVVLEDKGWLFFKHGEPNALMLGIDWPEGADKEDPFYDAVATIETHCRRCGSHMGHYFNIGGQLLQCINGSSLNFRRFEV